VSFELELIGNISSVLQHSISSKKIRNQDCYNSFELFFSDYLEKWSRMENFNQVTLDYIIIRKHLQNRGGKKGEGVE
jgi:hypothetical protein